jgi:hypothetical protein
MGAFACSGWADECQIHILFLAAAKANAAAKGLSRRKEAFRLLDYCIHKLSVLRSADLKSAVSQDCILLGRGVAWGVEKTRHAADFKSAIRQECNSARRAQESRTTRGCTASRLLPKKGIFGAASLI